MRSALTSVSEDSVHSLEGVAPVISAQKLANLDFGIFRALRSLGTERDRICAAMGLNSHEFEYLEQLA